MVNRYGNLSPLDLEGINSWEQLQDVLQWTHNKRVIAEFRDTAPEDATFSPDFSLPRHRLRVASTILEDDTSAMVLCRFWLFYVILGKAAEFQTPIYGIPVPTYQETLKFKPQIQLYFQEDLQDVERDYSPVTGEISVRLMDETSASLTDLDLNRYASKINTLFGSGSGFVWRKGKTMAAYTDREKGYSFRLLCKDAAEGKRVIEQALDIQSHTPDWKHLTINQGDQPSAAYPTVPPLERILGESRRMPRSRPIASVRFQTAYLHIRRIPRAIVLLDRSGRHRVSVQRAS
jgi:hypothetical protein